MEEDQIENKPVERPAMAESKEEPANNSATLMKLFALVTILFVAVKYGQPLMSQIADKSTEAFAKDEKSEDQKGATPAPLTPAPAAKSSARITTGYEAWEPEVRAQLDEWVGEGHAYELTHIGVHKSGDTMEIRYRTIDGASTTPVKLTLKKDGIDDRFIFQSNEGKEFLVYPPQ